MTQPAKLAASKIIEGPLPASAGPHALLAFGDRDDPQRLAVLLSEHIAASAADPELEQQASTCLQPKTTWRERLGLIEDMSRRAASITEREWFVRLGDLDALAASSSRGWDDDGNSRMRKELFELVMRLARGRGWLLSRTFPNPATSKQLAELDLEVEFAGDSQPPDESQPFAPEVRPIARWLVQRQVLDARGLARIVESVLERDAHVVALGFDALTPKARDSARLLAQLRPAHHLNGALGPVGFHEGPPTATTVPRKAVTELLDAGFLQRFGGAAGVRVPRVARELVKALGPLGVERATAGLHCFLAQQPTHESSPPGDVMEIHHHAICAGDEQRAKQTAQFYGTELRVLATRLSVEAARQPRHSRAAAEGFKRAAELFDYILTTFDATDAYAWEYKGYNLARSEQHGVEGTIRLAYEKAHSLWQRNPLYHGRLLGYRGQLGEDVAAEVLSWLDRYVEQYGTEGDAVSKFAEMALKGLERGGRQEQIRRIVDRRRSLLQRFAPSALTPSRDE